MERGLQQEGVTDARQREEWKNAMRLVVMGGQGVRQGENPDLNPYMLAGESGGRYRGGANAANSSALGYFQFITQSPKGAGTDHFGHWKNYSPTPNDPSRMTDPVTQIQMFIRAVRNGRHKGNPMSVVNQKRTKGTWDP
jgi:hypothetical protein